MNRKLVYIITSIVVNGNIFAQDFPPAAGMPGTSAMHVDTAVFTAWGSHCMVERGYINIADTNMTDQEDNHASYGDAINALGAADNAVVSLGDGGYAIVSFDTPVQNNPGFDFAVFENSFTDNFLELAFVEVSTDGERFVRFPAYSNTQYTQQIESFGELDPTYIHNLAGKYKAMYGTPFDLEDVKDSTGINVNQINYIKIVDVVGSIDESFAQYDVQGNIINDPWPTPFASCGFDLDAVGILQAGTDIESIAIQTQVNVFPNPAKDFIHIDVKSNDHVHFYLYSVNGQVFKKSRDLINDDSIYRIDISAMPGGIYFLALVINGEHTAKKLVKTE